ncbi:MAG TPA: primase C-terminal domain-containing protein [Planctomycetota bacterium]|nr:primase C-terminal domain-containing protein [Planctomycetota bacterium]
MSAFADFVLARLANRTDTFGRYVRGRTSTAKEPLTAEVVERHEAGEALVGLHAIGTGSTCRWVAWDFDNHSEDPAVAARNLKAAEELCEALRQNGAEPILEDSDGQGGYHVWVVLSEPIASARAHAWAVALAPEGVEPFPKQAAVGNGNPFGNWLRLPGRHPRRDHASRIRIPSGWIPWDEYPWDDAPSTDAAAVPEAPARKPAAPEGTERLADFDDTIREGTRNDVLFRLGAFMRGKGFGEASIVEALLRENAARCHPPLPEEEVRKAARSAARYQPSDGVPIPASEDRESILMALNEALSQHNRALRIARIVRRGEKYAVTMDDGRTAGLRDTSYIRNFDRFADAIADAAAVNLDPKLRKSWTAVGQMILDVVEEVDVETQNDETRGWLAAVQDGAGAVVDLEEAEDVERVKEHGRVPFLRRDGVLYALTQPLCARLRQAGVARAGVREMADRLSALGWTRVHLGFGARGDQKRFKAWMRPEADRAE